ncbi:MAG: thioredoxin domain-containing protein [Armatimonadetes bacterium]|nr:thioredoxin domain-containing protein [Armatimonadota bacterium]
MKSLVSLCLLAALFVGGCRDAGKVASAVTQDNAPPEGYNRLYFATSPYLKLHETNPVDWYEWGDEAFEKAKKENKLIFLSIGYSTCHWCHVMEEESFAKQDVADALSETFVSIKVDREELPGVDHVFMQVTQGMTGRGGWPNTILLTPDRKPIYAATYIPHDPLLELLAGVKKLWNDDPDKIQAEGDRINSILAPLLAVSDPGTVSAESLQKAADGLMSRYDELHGGFGNSPKFPSPANLIFLLRMAERQDNDEYKNAVLNTLTKMRLGGIYDQVGYGFHRYSTDRIWRTPHFEKMLYDQALHVLAYTEAYQITGLEIFKRTVDEILTYVSRDMSDGNGGFWSAQDADSDGEEGKFYVWSVEQLAEVLSSEEVTLAKGWFHASDAGNFRDEATGAAMGSNILEFTREFPDTDQFHSVVKKLRDAREKRVHPLTDDKILTDWNGLMIAAYARAGYAFDRPEWIARAQRAAAFIDKEMASPDGKLAHSFRGGQTSGTGFIDDYAFLLWGLVELYQADFDVAHLTLALKLVEQLKGAFLDEENGGLFMTAAGADIPIGRPKEATDGALPSGNGVAAWNMMRLGRLLGRTDVEEMGRDILAAFGGNIAVSPDGYIGLLFAADFTSAFTSEVVVVGEGDEALKMMRRLQAEHRPNAVFVLKDASQDSDELASIASYTELLVAQNGKTTVYVCHNFACELPTTDVNVALKLLLADD